MGLSGLLALSVSRLRSEMSCSGLSLISISPSAIADSVTLEALPSLPEMFGVTPLSLLAGSVVTSFELSLSPALSPLPKLWLMLIPTVPASHSALFSMSV